MARFRSKPFPKNDPQPLRHHRPKARLPTRSQEARNWREHVSDIILLSIDASTSSTRAARCRDPSRRPIPGSSLTEHVRPRGRRRRRAARPAPARGPPRRSLQAPSGRVAFARAPSALSDAAPSSSRAAEEAAAFARAPPAPAPRKARPLRASDFRHPLDQQNTQLLEAIPGVSALTKSLVTPVAERALILEQISTSVLVGPEQLPHVHQMVLDAAAALDVEPPALYIRQNPQPNAHTLAVSGRTPVVVVHSALVELMDAAELQAVIAHELGHLKCDHGVWLTVANLLSLGIEISPLVPAFVVDNVRDELLRWSRAAELTCATAPRSSWRATRASSSPCS